MMRFTIQLRPFRSCDCQITLTTTIDSDLGDADAHLPAHLPSRLLGLPLIFERDRHRHDSGFFHQATWFAGG